MAALRRMAAGIMAEDSAPVPGAVEGSGGSCFCWLGGESGKQTMASISGGALHLKSSEKATRN